MCPPLFKNLRNVHCLLLKGASKPQSFPLSQAQAPLNSHVRTCEALGLKAQLVEKGAWETNCSRPRVCACVKWTFTADPAGTMLTGQLEIALSIPGRGAVGETPVAGPSLVCFPMAWPLVQKVTGWAATSHLHLHSVIHLVRV